jgi:YfiH family protein
MTRKFFFPLKLHEARVDHNRVALYFGNASDALFPAFYQQSPDGIAHPLTHPLFSSLQTSLAPLENLFFPLQVHGTAGIILDSFATPPSFFCPADFILTQQNSLGIGIVSADCVPVIMYDPAHHVIGIAHAGWRGAEAGVVPAMLTSSHATYETKATEIFIWIGPCAHRCCYEVDETFANLMMHHSTTSILEYREKKWFFNLVKLVAQQCTEYGIPPAHISHNYTCCTIHTPAYYSYRRQGAAAGRQATIIFQMPL